MKIFQVILFLLLFLSHPLIAAPDIENLKNDLHIMKNILDTALKQEKQDQGIRYRNIDVTYLMEQGVLFQVYSQQCGWHCDTGFSYFGDHVIPVPPMPHVEPFNIENQITHIEIVEQELNIPIQEVFEQDHNKRWENWEKSHQLKEEKRELSWKQKELDRKIRDMEFEIWRTETKRNKDLEKKLQQLNEKMKQVKKRLSETSKRSKEFDKKQKERKRNMREKYKAEIRNFNKQFEKVMSHTLCKYGAGLKRLSDKEWIAFILKDMDEETETTKTISRDRVYITSKKTVEDCVKDRLKPAEFINEMRTYVY